MNYYILFFLQPRAGLYNSHYQTNTTHLPQFSPLRHHYHHQTVNMQFTTLLIVAITALTATATTIPLSARQAGGVDFGTCTPTIDFQLGRPGRKATEGTFLPTDAAVAKGQQDALNPNIITTRVCDQLTNVCGANAAAKALCLTAKAKVAALGTKDASTAAAFNAALGL